MNSSIIKLYDSTLRDGAQSKGVNFSFNDKLKILEILYDMGLDYIEGGWPGANPTDDKFFKSLPKSKNTKVVVIGNSDGELPIILGGDNN